MKAAVSPTHPGDERHGVMMRLPAPMGVNESRFYYTWLRTDVHVRHAARLHRCEAFISPPGPQDLGHPPRRPGWSAR